MRIVLSAGKYCLKIEEMLKHLLLSINVTELNTKMPINFSMHKVMAFVGKPVIAQHMPEFHSVSLRICL